MAKLVRSGCLLAAIGLTIAPLLCGCGRRATSSRQTEIVYLTRATPDQLEVWTNATRAFMRRNPDVKVRFENHPYQQYWDKFQTMTAAGVAPDVIFMESTRFPKFVS
ncbi:MAG: extracellular solute-binding protein, partial [Armatimonadetes bacterium]|nr:extracellular solute-binding protein [Armatimonadota bacterium]